LLRAENKDIPRLCLRRAENKRQEASEKIAVTVTEESRLNTSTTIIAIQKSKCINMNMIYAKASILLILLSSFFVHRSFNDYIVKVDPDERWLANFQRHNHFTPFIVNGGQDF